VATAGTGGLRLSAVPHLREREVSGGNNDAGSVLRARLDVEQAARGVGNYLTVVTKELRDFARLTGVRDVHSLSGADLCTTSSEYRITRRLSTCECCLSFRQRAAGGRRTRRRATDVGVV